MLQSQSFPRLEIEQSTNFEKEIQDLFALVKHFNLAYKAKDTIYPLRAKYQNLAIGGGANHIWFHHYQEDGQIGDKRVAIIHFDPYYGL